jgi:hypothetical protein
LSTSSRRQASKLFFAPATLQLQTAETIEASKGPADYADDPVEYAENILGGRLTADQETILRHLLIPPCRAMVPSGNDTGKTFLAAVAASWWYDSFRPGMVYTVAPRHEHVVNVLWGQLRLLREKAGLRGHFIGPRAPMMTDSPDHLAIGITAARGESLKGRHIGRKLFIFEEATGLSPIYWETLPTMFDLATHDAALAIFNPTDTTSRCYQEDLKAQETEELTWHRFRLTALNHPNVLADLEGRPRPIPGAVNLRMVSEWVRDTCQPVTDKIRPPCTQAEREAAGVLGTDVEWPPGSGLWYRPGHEFQVCCLGLWPESSSGVWSDAVWAACTDPRRERPAFPLDKLPEVGCDMATGKGDDYHAIHAHLGRGRRPPRDGEHDGPGARAGPDSGGLPHAGRLGKQLPPSRGGAPRPTAAGRQGGR